VKGHALVATIVVAMTLSAVSLAGPKTTAPSKKVTVLVLINDNGMTVSTFAGVLGLDGKPEPGAFTAFDGPVPRGNYLSFNVFNRGKKVHNFTIFGKKTPPIMPGHKAHLFSTALTRGKFLYQSTLDKSRPFRGYLIVH
jgi:hypothetical protein